MRRNVWCLMKISEFLINNGPGYYWLKFKVEQRYELEGPHYSNNGKCSIRIQGKSVQDKCRLTWNPKEYNTTIIEYNPAPYSDGTENKNPIVFMGSDCNGGFYDIDKYGEIGKDVEIVKIPHELHTYDNRVGIVIDAHDARKKLSEMKIDLNTLYNAGYLPDENSNN